MEGVFFSAAVSPSPSASSGLDSPTIVVTPKSKPPNRIPFSDAADGVGRPQQHIVPAPIVTGARRASHVKSDSASAPKGVKTPQQLMREELFGNLHKDLKDQVQYKNIYKSKIVERK